MLTAECVRRFCLEGRACCILHNLVITFAFSSFAGFILACVSLSGLSHIKIDNPQDKDKNKWFEIRLAIIFFMVNSLISWIIGSFLAVFISVLPRGDTARYLGRVMTGIVFSLLPSFIMGQSQHLIPEAFIRNVVEKATVYLSYINQFLAFFILLSALVVDIPAESSPRRTESELSEGLSTFANASLDSLRVTEAGMAA